MSKRQFSISLLVTLLLVFFNAGTSGVIPPDDAELPTQAQLIELISGNSNEGVWAGSPYRQYFSPDGTTRYQEERSRPSAGTWRVNEAGQYCSIWPPSSNEVCYNLLVSGDNIYWKSGDTYYRARVIPGNIFAE